MARHAPLIVSAMEKWCDGVVVKNYDGCKRVQRTSLYRAYHIKPWQAEVDARWRAVGKGIGDRSAGGKAQGRGLHAGRRSQGVARFATPCEGEVVATFAWGRELLPRR